MDRNVVLVNVGTVGHVDHGPSARLAEKDRAVLYASRDVAEDRFEIKITRARELPQIAPSIARNEPYQYGPRKKRGKGNKYRRV